MKLARAHFFLLFFFVIGCGVVGAPARGSPPLPRASDTLSPTTIAMGADCTYFISTSGDVVRVRGDVRDVIAHVDGDYLSSISATGTGLLSIGGDESVWYSDDDFGAFHAWNGSSWIAHDVTSAIGASAGARVVHWRVAARAIDDAWGFVQVFEGTSMSYRLCHWNGAAWTCEIVPTSVVRPSDAQRDPFVFAVSRSFVWMLAADGSVQRRDCDGVWTSLPLPDVTECTRDLQVADDDTAYLSSCKNSGGVAAWDGARFTSFDGEAQFFVARSPSDVWLARIEDDAHTEDGRLVSDWRQYIVSHFDGTSVTEIGHVDVDAMTEQSASAWLRIVPTSADAMSLVVLDVASAGTYVATAK